MLEPNENWPHGSKNVDDLMQLKKITYVRNLDIKIDFISKLIFPKCTTHLNSLIILPMWANLTILSMKLISRVIIPYVKIKVGPSRSDVHHHHEIKSYWWSNQTLVDGTWEGGKDLEGPDSLTEWVHCVKSQFILEGKGKGWFFLEGGGMFAFLAPPHLITPPLHHWNL